MLSRRSRAVLLSLTLALPAIAGETRVQHNASGQPTNKLVFDDAKTLISETVWTYEGGDAVKEVTTAGDDVTEITRTFSGGAVTEEVVAVNGQRVSRTAHTYDGGKLVKTTKVTPSATSVTTYAYDSKGRLVDSETRDGAGSLLTVSKSSYQAPGVPITIAASAGGAYTSDVDLTSLALGFDILRSPDPSMYEEDMLEVRSGAHYAYGQSQGEPTQNKLDAMFGLDLNHLFGKTTYFLFTTLARDPVVNLNLDLVVAPVGFKYDILQGPVVSTDISLAPVWNYRSITAPLQDCDGAEAEVDTVCASSKLRASLRYKLKIVAGPISFSDVVEYLPNLLPEDQSFIWALSNDSIFINTATLGIKLSDKLSLSESFIYKRDPTLAAQVDCEADPDNLLCDGMLYSTSTLLTYSQSF